MTHGMDINHLTMVALGAVAFVTLMSSWTSRINATFFFGRTIDPLLRYSGEAKAITRRYVVACWVAVLPVLALLLAGWKLGSRSLLLFSAVCSAISQQVAFARAHREAKTLTSRLCAEEGVVEVALGEPAGEATWWVPSLASIFGPLTLTAVGLFAALLSAGRGQATSLVEHWSALASGFDSLGNANLLGFGSAFVLVGLGILLSFRASVRLRTKMAQYTLRIASLLAWTGTAVLLWIFYCAVRHISVALLSARIVMFTALALAFTTQVWNQWRSREFVPAPAELHGDDRWQWGLYYRNPGDPALFVQRRTGMGFTLNYGRGWAWVITAGFVAYFVAIFSVYLRH